MKYPLGIDFLQNEEKLKEHLKMASSFSLKNFPKSIEEIRSIKKESIINRAWKQIELSKLDNAFMIEATFLDKGIKGDPLKEKIYGTADDPQKTKIYAMKVFVPQLIRLRAKVAWAEILTFLHPDIYIPKILKMAIYYIKDDFTIKWMLENELNFKKFTSAIKPEKFDGRTNNKYDKHLVNYMYEQLVSTIRECRETKSMEPFTCYYRVYINPKFCYDLVDPDNSNQYPPAYHELYDNYKHRFLGKESITEIILEMLENKKLNPKIGEKKILIPDTEYLKKINTNIRKDFKGYNNFQKHFCINYQYLTGHQNNIPLHPITILEDFTFL